MADELEADVAVNDEEWPDGDPRWEYPTEDLAKAAWRRSGKAMVLHDRAEYDRKVCATRHPLMGRCRYSRHHDGAHGVNFPDDPDDGVCTRWTDDDDSAAIAHFEAWLPRMRWLMPRWEEFNANRVGQQ